MKSINQTGKMHCSVNVHSKQTQGTNEWRTAAGKDPRNSVLALGEIYKPPNVINKHVYISNSDWRKKLQEKGK
jgi:hypothetical protein